MSGVTGAARIASRADFKQFLKSYEQVLRKFPGFISIQPSGSYNSNPNKQDFGDIDLITHIQSDLPKAEVKKQLAAYLTSLPDSVVVPFSSPKYVGKRHYNSGEIITVRYQDPDLGYSVQIDNIIALDEAEAAYKKGFLDYPAEIQGLILGLVKVATIETPIDILLKKIGLNAEPLEDNQEYEFNASPVEIQLRKVTYEPGTYTQTNREIVWHSANISDLKRILYQYNIDTTFEDLLQQAQQTLKSTRSRTRVAGVFKSMISVKSGEIGTPKGDNKQAAINTIDKVFGTVAETKRNVGNLLAEFDNFITKVVKEDASAGACSSGAMASVVMPLGNVIKREQNPSTQKAAKYSNRSKPSKVKDIY
jgi:hypothetical protein